MRNMNFEEEERILRRFDGKAIEIHMLFPIFVRQNDEGELPWLTAIQFKWIVDVTAMSALQVCNLNSYLHHCCILDHASPKD